jgi:hypothetical protein
MARRLVSFGAAVCVWLTTVPPASAEDVLFRDRQPSPLVIDGKPADPVCLMHLANGDSSWRDPIDLRNCSHANIVIKSGSADPRMIGFEYDYRNSAAEMRQPYFLYRFLGSYRGHTLLFIEHGGGGTGEFTQIDSVDIQGHTLKPLEMLAGGDRCNGGVWHASLAGERLSYDRHATPYGVMALADKTPKADDQDAQWTSMSLSNPALKDEDGWTDGFLHQPCFNNVYRAFVARHETELDRDGVNRFAKAVSDSCLRAP